MGMCVCEMMIECEVKTGQTVESIENTRREGGDGVGVKTKQEDDGIISKTMKCDGKSRDLREMRLVKTSGEREERWLE